MTIKEQVIKAKLEDGLSYRQIKNEFGVPKSTARDWVIAFQETGEVEEYVKPYQNPNLQRVRPKRFKKTEDEVYRFLENLAPFNLGGSFKLDTEIEHNDYAVVLSDFHFPMHCERSIAIALETIVQLQPKTIILNGDTVDMLAVSRFPKDIRTEYSLLEEREAYQSFLRDLIQVSNGARILETHANHSGNGTEGRWFRYLSSRLGELASLPDLAEKLSYENIFLGEFKEWVDHVDYVELCPDLIVIHGDVVRKNAAYSARGMLEKYYQSLIMGHTHRVGMTAQRLPGIGTKSEKQLFAWEMGCMCSLDPIYASVPNWQNAFGIVSLGDAGESYGVEPVMIQNGKANIATLGCTIKA